MAGKPVATIGSMHVCPMCTGTVPHVGGPVIGPGISSVLMNGKPVAVMGDMCTCIGPPATIITGNPSILINGKPIACVGDMTAHAGSITVGEANITISSASPDNGQSGSVKEIKIMMPASEIPFPKITAADKIVAKLSGNGQALKEAEEKIKELKEDAKKHGFLSEFSFSA